MRTILERLKALIQRLLEYETTRRVIRTFYQAFLAVFVLTATGWIAQLYNWLIQTPGSSPPSLSVLASAFFAALSAGAVAVASLIHNLLEARGIKIGPGRSSNTS
jgi:hypothetical protein